MSTPEAAPEVKPSPSVPEHPRPRGNRLFGWFLGREELARAREAVAGLTAERREYLRRARLAFELGELALTPGNAVRAGSTAPLAANLHRQSLYWALLSQRAEPGAVTPEAAWAAADTRTLVNISANDGELIQIGAAMRSTFIELAEGSPEAQRATADLLRRAARRLVSDAQRPLWQLEWAKLKRLIRIVGAAVVCLAALAFGLSVLLNKPDLAVGKPWHTSSIALECHPEKSECGGAVTEILFHTKLEADPWFEYDFGAPLAFSSLVIRNRSDCCADRAVPLIVEVSNDDKKFQQIASRADTFATWRPSFPTQHARYLRLRVGRESILHLEAVQVHP